MKRQNLPALTWEENDSEARLGPGQSRPEPGARTQMYRLTVKPVDSKPMKVLMSAENSKMALRYALNRWPHAAVSSPKLVKL